MPEVFGDVCEGKVAGDILFSSTLTPSSVIPMISPERSAIDFVDANDETFENLNHSKLLFATAKNTQQQDAEEARQILSTLSQMMQQTGLKSSGEVSDGETSIPGDDSSLPEEELLSMQFDI